jgi:hypothetical protein
MQKLSTGLIYARVASLPTAAASGQVVRLATDDELYEDAPGGWRKLRLLAGPALDPSLDAVLPRGSLSALQSGIAAGSVVDCWLGESVTEGANLLRGGDNYREQVLVMLKQALPGVAWSHNNLALGGRTLNQLVDPAFKGLASEPGDLSTGFGPRAAGDRPWIALGKSWLQHARDLSPDVLFVPYGINLDYSDGRGVDKFATALETLIAAVQTWPKVPSVVLVTTSMTTVSNPAQPLWRATARIMREAAKTYGLALIDPNRRWQAARDLLDPATQITRAVGGWDTWTQLSPGSWSRNGAIMTPVAATGLLEFPTSEDSVLTVGMKFANVGQELLRIFVRASTNSAYLIQAFAGSLYLYRRVAPGALTAIGGAAPYPSGGQANVVRALEVRLEGTRLSVFVDGALLFDISSTLTMVEGTTQLGNTEAGYTPPILSDVQVLVREPQRLTGVAIPEVTLLGPNNLAGSNGNGINHPTAYGHTALLTPPFRGLAQALRQVIRSATATANFGTNDTTAEITVPATWITVQGALSVQISPGTSGDHDATDILLERLTAIVTSVTPGVSATVTLHAPNSTWGRYLVTLTG